ncbi:uncharacterized protein LOC134283227 [Saccostrea cucullata]|uniref:uncharacterized protein LOC134283227 n=1 Tax=Saccostrea cuccullata TaxID=36930 RepID=UPI002ED08DA6
MMEKVFLCILFAVVGGQKDRFSPNQPSIVKPGRCPVSNEITPCDCNLANIRCNGDQDCPGVQKCCSFGCGCRTRCEVPEGEKNKVCRYNGKFYKVGQSFPAGDGCNRCTCRSNGQVICTLIACDTMCVKVICTLIACVTRCSYNYRAYKPGQSFPSIDGCNRCTCGTDGRVSCTERACIRRCMYNVTYYIRACYMLFYVVDITAGIIKWVVDIMADITKWDRVSPLLMDVTDVPVALMVAKFCCGSNVFCTLRACIKPTSRGVCSQPKVVGPCRGAFRRWWYNKSTKRCELFSYGGCRGNQNNFRTKFACLRRCRRRY